MAFGKTRVLLLAVALLAAFCSVAAAASCKDLPNAIFESNIKVVKQLIEVKKCNVNTRRASDKYTLLHVALERIGVNGFSHSYDKASADMINYLVSKGANVKLPFPQYAGITGYTPLHYAAFDGNMFLVPLFVKHGANVNAVDQRGFTPLHSAARCDFRLSCDDCTPRPPAKLTVPFLWKLGARPVMKYLLSKGANILAKTKNKETVLDIVPTPCSNTPADSCKEYGAKKCTDMCTNAWRKKTWPSGSCQLTYFFVKDTIAAKQRG